VSIAFVIKYKFVSQTNVICRKIKPNSLLRWVGLFMASWLCYPLPPLKAEDFSKVDSWAVEAAFLRNFTRYVSWPESAFADSASPWRICVLGSDPFGEILEKTFRDHTEKGRPFSIIRGSDPTQLRQCQIVYIALKISMNRRAALAELKDLPVLTVSNANGFLREGGIIKFEVANYVRMNIDLDHARTAALSIQTKMLEVAGLVIDKGKIHRVR
jgi:hypothetical protein